MPIKKSRPQRTGLWLLLILAVGTFLRFYKNLSMAMWHDEAFSALYVRDYSWGEMMHRIGLDVHPPLYYWILRLWTYIFGTSLLSFRGFSILFGVLAIWAAFLFVKKAFGNERLALLSAFLIAINPFQIQYAVEARMYTFGTFLVLLSSYWLLKALETKKWRDWTIYAVLAAACLYTHYYLIFSVAAQGLFLLYWIFKNKKGYQYLGAYLITLVVFLPWLKQFLIQRGRVDKQFWIPAMDRWSIPSTIWKMLFGGQGIRHLTLLVATIVALVAIYYFVRKVKSDNKWLVLFGLLVPFVLSIAVSVQNAIYLDRYFVFASLFFTIIIAVVIDRIPSYQTRNIVAGLLIAMMIFAFFKNWYDMGIDTKPGMAKVSEHVNENAQPNDRIYVGSSFIYFTFRYYNQTGIHPRLISSGELNTIPHFSGTALLNPEDLILEDTIFNHSEVKKDDMVWLLWTTGFGSSKPNVPGTWSQVTEFKAGDAPGYKGDIYATEYHVDR
jgi:mannosyltransferase